MTARVSGLKVSVGFASRRGPRKRNEDFAGAVFGSEMPKPRHDVVAAIADGMGGTSGGRQAAEIAVRGFLDGFCDLPETMEVRRAAAVVLDALNGWIHSQAQRDPNLTGMGCTFTALVLRGRIAHVLHVGDTRAYRLSRDHLTALTTDHVRQVSTGRSNLLTRALGVETEVRLDYTSQPMAQHDRFLLCSDGVHGYLPAETIADIMRERVSSEDTARALVAAALQADSTDNCTALVLDVVGLATAQSADIGVNIAELPLIPVPLGGETVDGFVLKALLSDGRYSRLFGAIDEVEGGEVALKFPKPLVGSVASYRAAFVREAWVGARVTSPWLGHIIELPQGRQTCLYTVMPLYQGELLETRIARRPALGLEEGRSIGIKLARAAAALHRVGIVHRDIKPDNVILESEGSLKLIDFGVVRVPAAEDFPSQEIPGTLAYMAPEMIDGEPGNEATDVYALGVTLFRAFTGEFDRRKRAGQADGAVGRKVEGVIGVGRGVGPTDVNTGDGVIEAREIGDGEAGGLCLCWSACRQHRRNRTTRQQQTPRQCHRTIPPTVPAPPAARSMIWRAAMIITPSAWRRDSVAKRFPQNRTEP